MSGRGTGRGHGSRRGTGHGRGTGRGGWGSADAGPPADAPAGPPADPEAVARLICLRLLTLAPRTRAQLAQALARRGVPEEAASAVLERFSDVGLIDDAAFSRAWVSSRHRGRGLAGRALGNELRQRGVDAEVIAGAVAELDADTERDTAHRLVQRRLARLADLDPDVAARRLLGMLARKGYPAGVSYSVVRAALGERSAQLSQPDLSGPED